MKIAGIALAVVVLLLFGLCAALGDGDDDNSLGRLRRSHYECASHDCDGGSDGNTGYDGEGGRSGDTDQDGDGGNRCRNFCFYGVPLPGSGGTAASLFPPTPDGIRQFVTQTIQGGIELGRLFSDATITFVSNLLVGVA